MIDWLKNLFKEDKNILIGTLAWTVNWIDVGCKERGVWLLYQRESGGRSFEISNKATMMKTHKHPAYGEVLAWSKGGELPSGVKFTQKGETHL